MLALANPFEGQAQKNIEMILQVIGRSTEKLTTEKCGVFNSNCYVTPLQGTGTAGKNCAMYKPNSTGTVKVDFELANSSNNLDQLNYSCNWNKLIFGSGQTDRVAVPLYYDSAGPSGVSEIVNPYSGQTPAAKNLIVRLRTPCKPCAVDANPDFQRACDAAVKDETVCEDKDRYVLDTGINNKGDDVVVQWLINGECTENGKTEACGVMPIADKKNPAGFSALYESKIYSNSAVGNDNKSVTPYPYSIIDNATISYDANAYPKLTTIIKTSSDPKKINSNKLSQISKPVLTLFLNKPLLTEKKSNIPYLEYQVLTDSPVGNSKSTLEAIITVDGNGFRKTLTKDVQKDLIDFAINN